MAKTAAAAPRTKISPQDARRPARPSRSDNGPQAAQWQWGMELQGVRWYYYIKSKPGRPCLRDANPSFDGKIVVCLEVLRPQWEITNAAARGVDLGPTKRHYTTFDSPTALYHYMGKLRKACEGEEEDLLTMYEVFFGDQAQKPHFDLDAKPDRVEALYPEMTTEAAADRALEALLDALAAVLTATHPLDPARQLLVYSSHSPVPGGKRSFHVVVDGLCCATNSEAEALYQRVVGRMAFGRELVDHAVYSSLQNFRLLANHKAGDTRVKQMVDSFRFRGATVVHQPTEDAYGRGRVPIEEHLVPLHLLTRSLVGATGGCALLPSYCEGRPRKAYPSCPVAAAAVDAGLAALKAAQPELYASFEYEEVQNGLALLRRTCPSHCPLCGRTHEHENSFLSFRGTSAFWHCRRDGKRRLPLETGVEAAPAETEEEEEDAILFGDFNAETGQVEKPKAKPAPVVPPKVQLDALAYGRPEGRGRFRLPNIPRHSGPFRHPPRRQIEAVGAANPPSLPIEVVPLAAPTSILEQENLPAAPPRRRIGFSEQSGEVCGLQGLEQTAAQLALASEAKMTEEEAEERKRALEAIRDRIYEQAVYEYRGRPEDIAVEEFHDRYVPDLPRKHRTLIVQSHMATGKSTSMGRFIEQLWSRRFARDKETRVLLVTPRVALSIQHMALLRALGFVWYGEEGVDLHSSPLLVIQYESLHRLVGSPIRYDLVVLDEITALVKQFSARTKVNKRKTNYQCLVGLMSPRCCKRVLAMDAEVSRAAYLFIRQVRGAVHTMVNTIPFSDVYGVIQPYYVHKDRWVALLREQVDAAGREDKRVAVACASLEQLKRLQVEFADLADQGVFFHSQMDRAVMTRQLRSINETAASCTLMAWSPSVTVGTDILEQFERVWWYPSTGSCDECTQTQMWGRVRHNVSRELYIVENYGAPRVLPSSLEAVRETLRYRAAAANDLRKWYGEEVADIQDGKFVKRVVPLPDGGWEESLSLEGWKQWYVYTRLEANVTRSFLPRLIRDRLEKVGAAEAIETYAQATEAQSAAGKTRDKKAGETVLAEELARYDAVGNGTRVPTPRELEEYIRADCRGTLTPELRAVGACRRALDLLEANAPVWPAPLIHKLEHGERPKFIHQLDTMRVLGGEVTLPQLNMLDDNRCDDRETPGFRAPTAGALSTAVQLLGFDHRLVTHPDAAPLEERTADQFDLEGLWAQAFDWQSLFELGRTSPKSKRTWATLYKTVKAVLARGALVLTRDRRRPEGSRDKVAYFSLRSEYAEWTRWGAAIVLRAPRVLGWTGDLPPICLEVSKQQSHEEARRRGWQARGAAVARGGKGTPAEAEAVPQSGTLARARARGAVFDAKRVAAAPPKRKTTAPRPAPGKSVPRRSPTAVAE